MSSIYLSEQEVWRIRLVMGVMAAALVLLVLALADMQILRGHRYQTSLEEQSVRRIRIPATRGQLVDRHGICLADNRPDYGIAVYLEELRPARRQRLTAPMAWQAVQQVAAAIQCPPQVTPAQIEAHLYHRKALPLLAWRHVDQRVLARLAEAGTQLPAVDIVVDSVRLYPLGPVAAHVLGYVGSAEPEEDEGPGYDYSLPDLVGKSGLERRFEQQLQGQSGGRLLRVDVSGFMHDEIGFREPVPGDDLMLTLDVDIQRVAEQVLADTVGAVVVLDPRNGEVLAMASSPGYDPNILSPAISVADWSRLALDSRKPLLNRAVNGLYAPGSIFKPLVALAALEQGRADARTVIECPGYFEIGGQKFSCFMGEVHGRLTVQEALEVSCNVFFYQFGVQCGLDPIYQLALAMGLGQPTGIEMDAEAAGLLPGKIWKRRVRGEAWRDGDTCNLAVGQGALMVTPLQMAVMTATIANGGYLYRPQLIRGMRTPGATEFQRLPPALVRRFHWAPAHLALVKAGLRDVVQSPRGTGHLACLPDVVMAGKTGTAEYGPKGSGFKHGWMILFAPFDQPRYAVAMVLDEAVTGGSSVGPRVGRLMGEVLALNRVGESG